MRRILVVFFMAGCNSWISNPPPPPPPAGTPSLKLIDNFSSPTYLASPPADSQRLFVVEQGGAVRVLHNDTVRTRPFLDLSGRISSGGERGLLSIAFHPDYASNGRFYVYFTNPAGDIRIVRYTVSSDPDSADEATADTVLRLAHPGQSNHNGGQLQFGPDGMLWVGTGDGGGSGDPNHNAQNKHALLGKLLRLDVNGATAYAIPADNPFNGDTSFAPEVWSYGLRNPWRFSFDRQTGDLYIGDVGQDTWEEVDISPVAAQRGRTANFGWNIMEGKHCYPSAPCDSTHSVLPVLEYPHAFGACAITGGYVYRGNTFAAMRGHYFYADFCNGDVHSFAYPGGTGVVDWSSLLSPGPNISSFGQDVKGELYVLQLSGGVYRIVPHP
ncbi:MAG TPA: PQQ-dependent sugar dehydrogenase [Gemmatimonadales bacterium]|nr:PQQ-dependent sugar dehydrogenase [Gemmatimonadales bacterium]